MQGYLKLLMGQAMIGQSHDYKWHGTTTLFAALNVATGQVIGRHYKRRRRVEFLSFYEHRCCGLSGTRNPRHSRHLYQLYKPKRDMWWAASSQGAIPLYTLRPIPLGLIKSKSGLPTPAGNSLSGASFGNRRSTQVPTSKALSTATTMTLIHSSGQKAKFTKSASKLVVHC